MNETTSPCRYCSRVLRPENCDIKECALWRSWFIRKWEQTRALFTDKPATTDPCQDCPWAGPLCTIPCPVRQAYDLEGRR